MSALAFKRHATIPGKWDLELNADRELHTAVTIILLTHARARKDDRRTGDLRGWPGDSYPDVPGRVLGCRLWLHYDQPITDETPAKVAAEAHEALSRLVEDGAASKVEVAPERVGDTLIALRVSIQRPEDAALQLIGVWEIALTSQLV